MAFAVLGAVRFRQDGLVGDAVILFFPSFIFFNHADVFRRVVIGREGAYLICSGPFKNLQSWAEAVAQR